MSAVEDALRDLVRRRGFRPGTSLENQVMRWLPVAGARPEQQHQVGKFRLDFAWPGRKIGLEAEGWWHRSPEGAASDRQRDSWLRSQGWVIFRVDDEHGEESLKAQVERVVEETTAEDWRLVMSTDLDSCFYGARAALPYLKQSRGSIVHIAPASRLGGDHGLVAYNAAKGAVVNFARGLAFDLGEYGIRVNTVAPALTTGEEYDDAVRSRVEPMIERFNARRALNGHSTPADVAAAVAFLASEDARFITGVVLPVDGGITAGSGQPGLFSSK